MEIRKHVKGKRSSISQSSDVDLSKKSVQKLNKILNKSSENDTNKRPSNVDSNILTDCNFNQQYESNYSLNYSNPIAKDHDRKAIKNLSHFNKNDNSIKMSNEIIDFKMNSLIVDEKSQLDMLEYNKFENCKK